MSKVFFGWLFLHTFKYFNYISYDPTLGGQIGQILDLIVIGSILLNNKINNTWYLGDFVLFFLTVPILAFFPAYFDRGQSFLSSLQGVLDLTKILIYYYLYKFEIKERLVLNFLMAFVVIRFSITAFQQWNSSDFFFVGPGRASKGEFGTGVEIRGGVYRFMLDGEYFSPLVFFYAAQKLLEKFRWKLLLILLISLGGIFLDQTRQSWSAIIVIFLFFIFPKLNVWSKLLLIFLFFISETHEYIDLLFGNSSATSEEFNTDNVRWLAAYFFLFEYWNGNLSLFFGNGLAHKSSYFLEIASMQERDGFYRVDIGIVGYFNQYGIYGLIVLSTFFAYVYRKYWKFLDLYIKLFALYSIFLLPTFIGLTGSGQYWLFLGMLLFLIDCSIKRNASAFRMRK